MACCSLVGASQNVLGLWLQCAGTCLVGVFLAVQLWVRCLGHFQAAWEGSRTLADLQGTRQGERRRHTDGTRMWPCGPDQAVTQLSCRPLRHSCPMSDAFGPGPGKDLVLAQAWDSAPNSYLLGAACPVHLMPSSS